MIASGRKRRLLAVIILLVAIGLAIAATQETSFAPANDGQRKEVTSISFDDNKILAEVVRSIPDKQKGLGGRDTIGSPGAMLFIYDRPDPACFWMKDMRFAIDIVWLDADKKVVSIKERVSPSTYPESFCPKEPAQYVLELPEGKSQELGLHSGLQLQF